MSDPRETPDVSSADPVSSPGQGAGDRLSSWKEIAAHLGRDVRTVQRWERAQGLPVHRHRHSRLSTAYAFKSELDAWWHNQSGSHEPASADGTESDRPDAVARGLRVAEHSATAPSDRPGSMQPNEDGVPAGREPRCVSRGALLVAAAGVVAALAVVVAGYGWRGPDQASASFAARDFVLIVPFENRTGDPLFDGTVEYALERELADSRFVNVTPRLRIQDTLELMRKPADTPLDPQLGREVALRDGQIPVLLAGRVERFGTRYVVTADVSRTADGWLMASVREEAASEDDAPAAIRRLALDIRKRLGERLESAQAQLQELPKVTTTALRALQLFAKAMTAVGQNESEPVNRDAAVRLLREATAIDPDFAQAHMTLALVATGGPRPDTPAAMWPHVERAVAAAKQSPQLERLLIEAQAELFRARHMVDADGAARQAARARAVTSLEAVLRVQPDHLAALNWLRSATQYFADGRTRARDVALRYAELRPTSAAAQIRAAQVAMDHGDAHGARRYVARARALHVPATHLPGDVAAWLALFDANDAWLSNDVHRSLAVADRFAAEYRHLPAEQQERAVVELSFVYLSLGRLRQSEQVVAMGPAWRPQPFRDQHQGRVIALRGDRSALAAFLSDRFRTVEEANFVASNMMDAGLLDMGRQIIDYHRTHRNEVAVWYDGQLSLAEGRIDDAIRKLTDASLSFAPMTNQGLKIARQLGDAHRAAGRLDTAIQLLEEATRRRSELIHGWEWLRSRDRLAAWYREAGRADDARAVDRELATLLAVADDDHFIKRRLAGNREPPP